MIYRKLLYRFSQSMPGYVRFVMILLAIQLILRLMEFALANIYGHAYFFMDVLLGSLFDVLFAFSFGALLFIPYFLLVLFSRKVANGFLYFCLAVLAIFGYGFSNYFALMMYPVNKVVFSYSLSDLSSIIQTGGSFDFYFVGSIIICMILLFYVIQYIKKIRLPKFITFLILLLMLISFNIIKPITRNTEQKCSESTYHIRVNKMAFFIEEIRLQMEEVNARMQKLDSETIDGWRKYYKYRNFARKAYPLLHSSGNSHVLSDLLEKETSPPNIIIVIVESLTRCYSGPDAWAGSYTPFLDSLAKESLYWENFVSTSERTISVLPSVLGSLPSANNGFSHLAGNMPNHLSLISILNKNGYQSNFYYGGDPAFDNTNIFLSRQGISHVESGDYYSKGGLVYWGLSDSAVYQKSIQQHRVLSGKNPSLSVYLTLSTHGPYDIPGLSGLVHYLKSEYSKDFTDSQKEYLENHSEQLASYYYADQQIKALFDSLKYIGAMENALFMVTGDHGLSWVCSDNPVKRYHIPFLLYSPQLKRTMSIKAINSHYNVTPSLLAYLEETYNLNIPARVHWLGSDFDTSNHIRSINPIPIMEINRSVDEVIFGEYLYSKGKLFHIKDGLGLKPVNQSKTKDKLKQYLDSYQKVNRYACNFDKLMPQIYYAEWGNTYELQSVKEIETVKFVPEKTFEPIYTLNKSTQEGNYQIKLEFNLEVDSEVISNLPVLIAEVNDSLGQRLSYSLLTWIDEWQKPHIDLNKQISLSIETSIPTGIPPQKCQVKVYIWNNHNVSLIMKDIKVRLFRHKQ